MRGILHAGRHSHSGRAFALAITPNGASAYLPQLLTSDVAVIDTATNTVATTVFTGGFPQYVAITPDGAFVYVTNGINVSVIDTATNTLATTILGAGTDLLGITILVRQPAPPGPTSVGQCKNGGWAMFTSPRSRTREPAFPT